jgi:5-methylcytosine-specific restriction protein A
VLHYTGMGTKGSQQLQAAQNRTVAESATNGVAVHLFEVFEPGRYICAGEVALADEPYQEQQFDIEGNARAVWMFPLRLKANGLRPIPTTAVVRRLQMMKERTLDRRSAADLKQQAKKSKSTPSKRSTSADLFVRDPYVAAYVKKAANGFCDLCKQTAPFKKKGQPFLHCHHVVWLARGGPDVIKNTVAVCPNCHERMHQLDKKSDVERLKARMAQRDPELFAPA